MAIGDINSLGIPDDLERLRCIAIGAAHRCPRNEPVNDCPLKNLRGQPLSDRLEYVMRCDDYELEHIASFHYSCSEGNY